MLSLEYSGHNYSKKRCESKVNWFVEKYLPRHKLEIVVHHRGLLREGAHGFCTVMDCDWRPRSFEIEMHNRMDVQNYTIILLHELWHVYQHVKGDLKDRGEKRYWRGIDHSYTDYSDQPWEQEAREMEVKLYNSYLGLGPGPFGSGIAFPNRLTAS